MNIVCVFGSPRTRGNSASIAKRFCETAGSLGAEIKYFHLNKLVFTGCQACMSCKTKLDRCALKDDLTEVLDAVRDTDVLVIATPVYYGEVSSQTKAFIDRTFSYVAPDYMTNPASSRLSPGKKLLFIQVQAQPDERKYNDIYPRYDYFFKWYGFNESYLIRACGLYGIGEADADKNVMTLAEETAHKVMT